MFCLLKNNVVFDTFCTILKSGGVVKYDCNRCFSEVFYMRVSGVCVCDLENCKRRNCDSDLGFHVYHGGCCYS
jgi:hypothetical protein